ncbi:MAG: response regulator [Bradyrhizobium sp.]|uniref:hybrid sensor histidine kinase/response regulator n=1 Tax=Bradyrhizobium sp. TaxID=376 RepID=UPI002724EF1B|nr:response regulator [Bradyrhizobium sp.]MDO8397943.1 response regulator [Bradyrhizobium sp.]
MTGMPRVLIVDDSEDNLYYLRTLLGAYGYEVESALHGAEALEKARHSPPGLVISDLLMPVMDGYTLLRHWRQDDHLRNIPFVVYTATYTSVEDERLAINLGADAFIVKPKEPDEFMAAIGHVLSRVTGAGSKPVHMPEASDQDIVKQYSAALVRKLEDKTIQLEAANRALQQEIAERKLADMRLETLIEQANIGILVHRNFKPILANGEMARIFGYASKDEIQNMPDCKVLVADGEWERIEACYRERLDGRDAPVFYDLKGKKKDGTFIDLENRAFAIQWDDQLAVCSMLTDVTQQRKVEAQLRQSLRLEAVGQMTGGIAHDFNNLLTIIIGNAELIEESSDPALRALAEVARKAAERGAELTGRLLAFSRQQPLDPKAIDINLLISKMDGLIRRAIGGQLEIKTVLPANLWHVFVDPAQLENALLNLAINARDAMPDGGRLTIETSNIRMDEAAVADRGLAPGDYLLVTVSDTGTGMDRDTLARAFEPFFTTKEVGKGSGLGLSMVYGFVAQSRGHVRIHSAPGQGTSVRIYLPRAADEIALARPEIRDGSLPRGSEKILLVDDDAMVREMVVMQLQNLGYRVVSAVNGSQALDLLKREGGFDLLFTDVVMPGGLNGRQLAGEARKLSPGLRVILSSGYADTAVPHQGGLDQGVHLLNKPYRRSDLAKKVREALT